MISILLVSLALAVAPESLADSSESAGSEAAVVQEVEAPQQEQASEEEPETPAYSTSDVDLDDPCRPKKLDQDTWVDRLNRRLFVTVCNSAEWFDEFFGSDWAADEAAGTYGIVSTSVLWTEYEDFGFKARARVRVPLPNLERRMHAFVGRVDEEEYLTDTGEFGDSTRVVRGPDEDSWIVGLGFTPIHGGNSRFTVSAGVNASLPVEPYVKGQYRWFYPLPHDWLFRWRQTVFWEGEDGLGTTLGLDLEKRFSDRVFLRWANANTISQGSEGVRWWSTMTLFHLLSRGRALAWTAWASGETQAPVPLWEYGLRLMFRRRLHREWLFGEVGTGVYWPRHQIEDVREASLGLWVGVSLQFGEGRPSFPSAW